MGQTTLEQAKAVLMTSQILLQATKAWLRYKRVDFRETPTSYTHFPFCSTHLAYHKPYLRVRAVLLHSSDTCPASVGFPQR